MKNIFFLLVLCALQTFAQQHNPIGFTENKGQIVDQQGRENKSVLYLLNTHGLNVQLKKNGFSYDIYETKKHTLSEKQKGTFKPKTVSNLGGQPDYSLEYIYHRIDIDFVNANANVRLVSEGKSVDYDNYYNVVHAPNGITDVHKYQKVTYQNIYNNIDVTFFNPKDSTKAVEYNFIVRPGGKLSDIQLKFNGVKTELVDNKIKMQVRFGKMEETLPLSWEEHGNSRKEIAVGYKQIKKNVYGFDGDVNPSDKTIVIDPTPVRLWGTYYGGYGTQSPQTIKTDDLGNVIISAESSSANNIATSGAFQTTNNSIWGTAFIGKLNPSGNRLWGTYINTAKIYNMAINSNHEIYIVGLGSGLGNSDNLTTPGAYKETNPSFSLDGLLLKFDSAGQRIWGTFYGGEEREWINTINLDSQENLIIAGHTYSPTGIATFGSFQTIHNDPFDGCGFFAKFTPSGTRIFGSYFPGKIDCSTIDENDNLVFAGQYWILDSDQPDISTAGAHQTQIHYMDGFIVKFNSAGARLWCTYYGGDQSFTITVQDYYDRITNIGTDSLNNIYASGVTNSINNISTPGAHKETLNIGGVDAFLVKFNQNGVRQWGTYYGSNLNDDKSEGGSVSPDGNIFITGNTRSSTDIATPGSFEPNFQNSDDGFLTKFNTNGQLVWGSYYGGAYQDASNKIHYDNGKIYIIGSTGSQTLGTPGTYAPTIAGGNMFVAKFQDCLSSPQSAGNNPCIGSSINLSASGGTGYSWTGPNSFSSTDQNPIILNANATHSGVYSCAITGTGGCDGTTTVTVTVGNTSPPVPTVSTLPNITGDCNTTVTPPTATTACSGIVNATTANPLTYPLPGTYTILWTYTDGNGNTVTQNQTVIISSQPLPAMTSPQFFCIQQNATLNDVVISGQNIKWYDALTGGNLLANTTTLQNNSTYYASQTIGGCESNRIPVVINIQDTPAPTGNLFQSFCANSNPTLSSIVVSGNSIIWYDSATGGSVLPVSTPLTDGTIYYASQSVNGCASPVRLAVTISLITSLPSNNYAVSLCDNLNDGSEMVNLTSYNANLIANPSSYSFSYYSTLAGAENQNNVDLINSAASYTLTGGFKTIYVHISNSTGCSGIVTLTLTLMASPVITLDDEYYLCQNSVLAINGTAGFDTYLWSDGSTGHSIIIHQAGVYTLTVTKHHNTPNGIVTCSTTKTFTVILSNAATILPFETHDWTIANNIITVNVTGLGDYEYSLNGIDYQQSNVFYDLGNGEYTVYVKDKNGCGIKTGDTYLLMYPKFFTPNGDSHNDFWKIKFSDNEPDLTVKIFDRYGKFITEFGIHSTGWDGTFEGVPAVATDYWFVVTRENGTEHRGHFSLKR